jgi:hypothetical protein
MKPAVLSLIAAAALVAADSKWDYKPEDLCAFQPLARVTPAGGRFQQLSQTGGPVIKELLGYSRRMLAFLIACGNLRRICHLEPDVVR